MFKSIVRAGVMTTVLAVAPIQSQELGTIAFPTSGAPAAQAAFLEGVKNLHSFQFDEHLDLHCRLQCRQAW